MVKPSTNGSLAFHEEVQLFYFGNFSVVILAYVLEHNRVILLRKF